MLYGNEPCDIILVAGQSNAAGSGLGSAKSEWKPRENILSVEVEKEVCWTPERTLVTYADAPISLQYADERVKDGERVGDLSLSFSSCYAKKYLMGNRKVLIVRGAVGGTAFCEGNWGRDGKLYYKLIEMTDYALSLHAENRVVALLWHQGESDIIHNNPPEVYYGQLLSMLLDIRARYGKMPIIAGDFVPAWKKVTPQNKPIIEKVQQVIKELGRAGFVDTEGLLSNGEELGNADNIHFCRQSLQELGERYFTAYEKIIKSKNGLKRGGVE